MNLVIKDESTLPGKYAAVTVKTQKACELFMSFCELEQMILSHSESQRPQFMKWVLKQQARYYNRFLNGFAIDMKWRDQRVTIHKKPTPLFLKLRNRVFSLKEETSTSAKADDSKFKIYQKSTDVIIAQ